jgi:hypothetical protein
MLKEQNEKEKSEINISKIENSIEIDSKTTCF